MITVYIATFVYQFLWTFYYGFNKVVGWCSFRRKEDLGGPPKLAHQFCFRGRNKLWMLHKTEEVKLKVMITFPRSLVMRSLDLISDWCMMRVRSNILLLWREDKQFQCTKDKLATLVEHMKLQWTKHSYTFKPKSFSKLFVLHTFIALCCRLFRQQPSKRYSNHWHISVLDVLSLEFRRLVITSVSLPTNAKKR